MRTSISTVSLLGSASLALALANSSAFFVAPTDVQMPGTQPLEAQLLGGLLNCDICHGYYDPDVEPVEMWMGSMMSQSGRDPVFWAAMAIAEGDFAGAGDYCIRCHSPRGWHEGRATPTDGSGLDQAQDHEGIECGLCHNMVNPDGSEHAGIQNAPYIANDGAAQPEGFYGSGMRVLAGDQTRYGPYGDATAGHPWIKSKFHRQPQLCGTCHEVSNPLVGDLATGNGAQVPLPAGQFSDVPGAPVTQKAAFLNPAYAYGIVERTFSEHLSSSLSSTPVGDFSLLPADLQRGAIKRAHDQAMLAGNNGNYVDDDQRNFSCQSCHMEPTVGPGTAFGLSAVRYDLPRHDLTGGNTWVPNAIKWLDNQPGGSKLILGQNISPTMSAAMDRGVLRARATLQRAGALDVTGANDNLRVTNLTGHKLITGYPEGRRMWLRVQWMDEQLNVLRDDGEYSSFTSNVEGTPYTVSSITDPNARIYEAKMAITQDWALELLNMGVDPLLPLSFDPVTGAETMNLAALALSAPGTEHETFHFILNNKLVKDTRIPPYQMDRDMAAERNALPVPATQYGNPGPGGVYDHFDDVALNPPAGATRAKVELLYQTSSWEYIQFLRLANPGAASSAFLADAGQDLLDAYMATGGSAPEVMTSTRWCNMPGTNEDIVMRTSVNGAPVDDICGKQVAPGDTMDFDITSPGATHQTSLGALMVQVHDPLAPPMSGLIPGLWMNQVDGFVWIMGVPTTGFQFSIQVPAAAQGMFRWQTLMFVANPANGFFALSDAKDFFTE